MAKTHAVNAEAVVQGEMMQFFAFQLWYCVMEDGIDILVCVCGGGSY